MQAASSSTDPPPVSNATTCPICGLPIRGTLKDAELHVNRHFDNESTHHVNLKQDGPRPIIDKPVDQLTPSERMLREVEESDAALAHSIAGQSPSLAHTNYGQETQQHNPQLTASLTETAEHCYVNILSIVLPLVSSSDPVAQLTYQFYLGANPLRRIHICTRMDYYSSNIAGLGWDCGFRNIQMIFSALLYDPHCRAVISKSGLKDVPSIPEIGAGIEDAWRKGHDQEGAAKMDGKLVGREVWIGAMEVQSFFRNIRINALVHDFETPTVKERSAMFEWIYKQFEYWCDGHNCALHKQNRRAESQSNTTIHSSLLSPCFLQYFGHSITIIGVSKSRMGEVSLIILDPSRGFHEHLTGRRAVRLELFQRGVNHPMMQHPRFQVVYIPSRPRNPQKTNDHMSHENTSDVPSANGQSNRPLNGNLNESNGTSSSGGGGKGLLRSFRFGKR